MPSKEIDDQNDGDERSPGTRSRYHGRNLLVAMAVVAVSLLVISLVSVVLYRTGSFDSYFRNKFSQRMAEMGISFDAESFRVTVNPLELHLRNASFNDRTTGERLFFIRQADLAMTVPDVFSMQLSRDISIDKTDINGAEVWVTFDENGRSNFSNVKLVENEGRGAVNFKYQSTVLRLQNSEVHFGDISRKISGNAANVIFSLSPENFQVPDEQKRYKFDLTASDSNFAYDNRKIDKIGIRANGIADHNGAEIANFELRSPIGESTMSGTLTDWSAPRYDLDIRSSIDLTQASSIFPIGTKLIGVGNFKGRVKGKGEN